MNFASKAGTFTKWVSITPAVVIITVVMCLLALIGYVLTAVGYICENIALGCELYVDGFLPWVFKRADEFVSHLKG